MFMVNTLGPGQTFIPAQGAEARRRPTAACVIVAFDANRPTDPPSRHWLTDTDEVSLGRSNTSRMWARTTENGTRLLRLRVPDSMVSARHTTLRQEGQRWVLHDVSSTNGTLINGDPTARTELESGDII